MSTGINNGLFPCGCGKVFFKQESLIIHKVMHTEEEHCEIEGKVFPQKDVLLKHIPENFSNFKEKQTVFNHRREFHLGDNSSLCPKNGINRKSIAAASDENIKTVGLVDPSKSFNDETTQNSSSFEKWGCKSVVKKPRLQIGKPQIEKKAESLNLDYLDVSVSTVKKPLHICPVCKTGYTTTTALKKHITSHFDNPSHSCENCHVKFKTRFALTYHRNQVHSDQSNPTKGKPSDSTRVKSNGTDSTKKPSKESSINAESQSQQPIRVRHSPSEDPHIWPKVFISRRLNDFLNLNQ